MNLAEFRKAIVASVPVVLAAAKVLSDALGNGKVTGATWTAAGVAALTAIAVYAVPNKSPVVARVPIEPAARPVTPDVSLASAQGDRSTFAPKASEPAAKPTASPTRTITTPKAKSPKEWD